MKNLTISIVYTHFGRLGSWVLLRYRWVEEHDKYLAVCTA